jgi:signal transduction histidine kinase
MGQDPALTTTTERRARRRFAAISAAAAVVTVVASVAVMIHAGGTWGRLLLGDIGYLVYVAVAAATAAWAAKRSSGRLRWSWLALAIGLGAATAGETLWSYYEVILRHNNPFPSLADVGFLIQPVGVVVALVLFPSRDGSGARRRHLFDGMMVGTALMVISWSTALGAAVHASGVTPFAFGVALAYPVADLVVLTMVVLTLGRVTAHRLQLGLLGAGMVLLAVGDSGYTYLSSIGQGNASDLLVVGWLAGYALLALAPLAPTKAEATGARVELPATRAGRTLLPYFPLAIAAVVLGGRRIEGHSFDGVTQVLIVIIVGLILIRQFATLRDNHSLVEQLRGAQAQLVDAARQAGMAEIATNVLHNVGNVLNSVNVSANLVTQKVRGSKSVGLSKAVALMHEHDDDLGEFLTTDTRGKTLPGYLDQMASALTGERESIEVELRRLSDGIAHIAEIVSAQQSLAGVHSVIEPVSIADVVEDALRMAGVTDQPGLTVIREVADVGALSLDRHRFLLILVNLINNAVYAMGDNVDRPRQLRVRAQLRAGRTVVIEVADNGEGIPAENLTRIFSYGFTTHDGGHGFGLHSSALAAKEMGGALTVHSDGAGRGARFILEAEPERSKVAA